ncbi:MAG: S24/S26 family peptidase [Clostridia bacterium]|nr:S24/S26 family peptidase [Clostridia bacterium]
MEQWCALARENAAPPVTICLEGESMRPLIRKGRDPVTIVPVRGALKTGDVVLFTLGDGRYVVHRVWKLREGFVRTLGDNCVNPEPWFPRAQVLGQVVRFSRNGHAFRLDTPAARMLGRVWMALFPMRRGYKRMRALAGRMYRRVFPRKDGA